MTIRRLFLAAVLLAAAGPGAQAQTAAPAPAPAAPPAAAPATPPGPPVTALPEVDVTASPELLSAPLPRDQVPAAVDTVTSGEVVRTGIPDMMGALNQNVPGVTLQNAGGNPSQPNLTYHGFSASALEGSDQGLAVYVNGARFNAPFGDTVNWDLIPAIAIDQMTIEGANPVFGLNALGGSLSVKMKNGFTFQGADMSVYGGSFGQLGSNFEWGREKDGTSTYVAGNLMDQGGWRQEQQTRLRQLYGDIGWRSDLGEAHLTVTAANNTLNQPGTLPVQILAADRSAVFTGPNDSYNRYLNVSSNVTYDLSDDTTLQALAYYENLSQRVINGNTPNFQACNSGNGLLCQQDGVTPLTGRNGAAIPAFAGANGPYSQLSLEGIDTNGYGASMQASDTRKIYGMTNNLVAGMSFDGGITMFGGNTLAGGYNPATTLFIGPGVSIDQANLAIAPTRVQTTNAYYGIYVNDILELTKRLSLTLSGRFNFEQIDLSAQNATSPVSGDHAYNHFNPGIGLTYKLLPGVSAYASYAESNRAPTPAELSCANINSPCSLANFFVGDPNLKQVVARTVEAGLNGTGTPLLGGKLNWSIDLYRTETQDDLIFAPSALPGLDYFQNVGRSQRQGGDLAANLVIGRVSILVGYSLTDATFRSPLLLDSPLNPSANALGQEMVHPGAQMPGVPMNVGKLGFDMQVTPEWIVGARLLVQSGQVLYGDEANLTANTGAYAVLDLNTSYQILKNLQVFAMLENALNAQYATYGTFSQVTAVPNTAAPGATNTRSLSPGAPIAAFGGVKMTF